jgi:uncharacterized protein YcaQ
VDAVSAEEARAIAVAAQGLGQRLRRQPRIADLKAVVDRLGLIQIDSVNVLARAHYMPFFSRLGPYRQDMLDELAYRERYLFEQWAHEACLIPMADYPMFRKQMERGRRWGRAALSQERLEYFEAVMGHIRERGPLVTGEVDGGGSRQGWWGWSHAKVALEYHFAHGRLAVRERRHFARVYDLPERVFDADVLGTAPVPLEDAHREMLRKAARALGIGTGRDLADYYRLKAAEATPRLSELVDAGELVPVSVEGWAQPAYLWPAAAQAPRVAASALVSPFDSLVWFRERTERMFGFHYRIEIYTPEPQRKFGYYVLPYLHNNQLVARVDLKANRQAKTLEVKATHLEAGANAPATARALAAELRLMQQWLGLEQITVGERGGLASALRAAVLATSGR